MALFFDDFELWCEVVCLDVIKEQMFQMRNLIMQNMFNLDHLIVISVCNQLRIEIDNWVQKTLR